MLMSHVSTMISTYESTEMLVGGAGRTAENMPDPTQPNDNPILKVCSVLCSGYVYYHTIYTE